MDALAPQQDLIMRLLERREHHDGPWHPASHVGGSKVSLNEQLTKLTRKGLIERRNVGKGEQVPYYHYRLSAKGAIYLQQHPKPPASIPTIPFSERTCPSQPSS